MQLPGIPLQSRHLQSDNKIALGMQYTRQKIGWLPELWAKDQKLHWYQVTSII